MEGNVSTEEEGTRKETFETLVNLPKWKESDEEITLERLRREFRSSQEADPDCAGIIEQIRSEMDPARRRKENRDHRVQGAGRIKPRVQCAGCRCGARTNLD